jgi:CheY-like chemotaxis protein
VNIQQPETPAMPHFSSMETTKTRSHRTLVVDDHRVNQQFAMMLIERLGHRTDVAANGQEAVDACSKIPYALVFMDCNMPVMDGYDATKKIREAERVRGNESGARGSPFLTRLPPHPLKPTCIPHVPIVAMTANTMPEDREKCLQAGMDDYLAKPIQPDSIAEIFAKWLPAHCTK